MDVSIGPLINVFFGKKKVYLFLLRAKRGSSEIQQSKEILVLARIIIILEDGQSYVK